MKRDGKHEWGKGVLVPGVLEGWEVLGSLWPPSRDAPAPSAGLVPEKQPARPETGEHGFFSVSETRFPDLYAGDGPVNLMAFFREDRMRKTRVRSLAPSRSSVIAVYFVLFLSQVVSFKNNMFCNGKTSRTSFEND